MKGITIIICCYNSEKRLPCTIEHLAKQKGVENIPIEVLVINNNCNDNTVEVANNEWNKYKLNWIFKVLDEQNAGLSYARNKGIQNASYEYIIFCDDDNWLNNDYVSKAFEIMERMPGVGIVGGHGEAVCEIEAPGWFEKEKQSYAVGKQLQQTGYVGNRRFVFGAGMIIRKSILKSLQEEGITSLLTDRKGVSLSSGGDSEICRWFLLVGYKIYYDENLKFFHFISKERLTEDYAKRLWIGFEESASILSAYDHLITFKQNRRKRGGFIYTLEIVLKILLGLIGIKNFENNILWNRKQLQLCIGSLIIYDPTIVQINRMFGPILTKKLSNTLE